MPGRSARIPKAVREARSPSRARRGHTRKPERAQNQRGRVFDRRLAVVAAAVTVALLAAARYCIDPIGPVAWSWPLLMLCVIAAATAGRALLGHESAAEEEGQPSRRFRAAIWLVLLGAATVPNLHGLGVGFLAEDLGLLRAARLAADPLDIARFLPLKIFYRPVSLFVWWLGLHLWDASPLGYHLLSVLLHAGNTALLYLLARRYVGSVVGGAMAALLFAVHPIHVEATTWLAAQPDLLCTAFVLSSMWLLEHYITSRGRGKHLALAGALMAFLLALWSKETAAAILAVAFVRLVIIHDDRRWARAIGVSAAYALTMGIYLGVRFLVLGQHWLGGYGIRLAFWDAVLSPTPWLLTGQLLFPAHVSLFKPLLAPYLSLAALTLMAAGLLWWMRSLVFVSWQRLILYASYLLAPMFPVSTAGLIIGADMANSRYGYLPSIGLALLFGEICARQRGGWRRGRALGVVTVFVAAVLSVWYVMPWREAARLREHLLAEGVRVVASLPDSPPPSTVFFKGVPFSHLGAAVFAKWCYAGDLSALLDGQVSVEDVESTAAAWNAMSASDLLPGEYLVSWNAESQTMVIERAGVHPVSEPVAGGPP